MSAPTFAEARAVLALQPVSDLLGVELVEFSHGYAELRIPVRPTLLQQHGYVHGGVLAFAADNALAFAGGSVLGPSVVTGGLTVDYVRPARGQIIRAVARVIASSSSGAVCHCDVLVSDAGTERLCATAQGSIRVRTTEPTIEVNLR